MPGNMARQCGRGTAEQKASPFPPAHCPPPCHTPHGCGFLRALLQHGSRAIRLTAGPPARHHQQPPNTCPSHNASPLSSIPRSTLASRSLPHPAKAKPRRPSAPAPSPITLHREALANSQRTKSLPHNGHLPLSYAPGSAACEALGLLFSASRTSAETSEDNYSPQWCVPLPSFKGLPTAQSELPATVHHEASATSDLQEASTVSHLHATTLARSAPMCHDPTPTAQAFQKAHQDHCSAGKPHTHRLLSPLRGAPASTNTHRSWQSFLLLMHTLAPPATAAEAPTSALVLVGQH